MRFRIPVTVVGLLSAAVSPLAAQSALAGIVRDDSTGRPLPGVEVLLGGTAHTTVTNAAGRYVLAGLQPGRYQVVFRMVGYLPARAEVMLGAGDTLRVNQVLVPSTVVLDPIEVTGAPDVGLAGRGFHERMKMGFGSFYAPEELREMEHLRLSDVLRRKGGVELSQVGSTGPVWAMHPSSRNAMGRLNCWKSIYLDGYLHWRGGINIPPHELERNPPPDFRSFLRVHELEAVEVYRSAAQLPVQFGGTSSACGAIVLWTRRAP